MQAVDTRKLRILLVSMPWRETQAANPGLGLLKAILKEAGHDVEVLDANLIFRARLGPIYSAVAQETFSEIAFAPLAYDGYPFERAEEALRRRALKVFPEDKHAAVLELPRKVALIFQEFVGEIAWDRYDIVGFSTTFNQTLASAAVARWVRARSPHVKLIVGGAACDGPMGKAMLEAFPFYDAAAVGRAEATVVRLCERVGRALGDRDGNDIPGTVVRAGGALIEGPGAAPRVPLDTLPMPDYDEFFALARKLQIRNLSPGIPLEASVGCWWGEKNLCSFCGLNATSLAFSQKSPERILAEIREVSRRYGVDRIEFTDNILPLNYYDTLVPELIELSAQGERYDFFVEIKTNVKKEQLLKLREAGFRHYQPGIESFSDHVLELMKKGNTAISQVQFIKWCDELGLLPTYNIIVANPGETAADYEEMSALIPSLIHLTPPSNTPPMMLERFSPYFDHPERYGIRGIRPERTFTDVFPGLSDELLSRLVYSFEYEHDEVHAPALVAARREAIRRIARWKSVHRPSLCTYRFGPGWVRIDDQREGAWLGTSAERTITLRGVEAEIYRYLDQARTPQQIVRELEGRIDADAVLALLDRLSRERLVYFDGTRALALALPAPRTRARSSTIAARATPAPAPQPGGAAWTWTEGRPLRRAQRAQCGAVAPAPAPLS